MNDNDMIIEAVGRNMQSMRDDFREQLRLRDQRGTLALRALDSRISATKEIAISAARGGKGKSEGYDPAGLVKLLATACRAKIARQSVDQYLAANPDPVAARFRTLIAEGKAMQFKAVTNPAQTTVTGWAAELVGRTVAPLASIAVSSAYGQLSARRSVIPLSFDGVGSIILPARTPGDLSGGFHGECAPLAVRRSALTAGSILPYWFGSISTLTREMSKNSNFEAILQTEIAADSTAAIDAALLSDDVATSISPAGLLAGATVIPPSSATVKADAAAEDLGALAGAIPNAADLVYISTLETKTRALIYAPGIASLAWITSPAAAPDCVVAIDAGSLGIAEGAFSFDVSEEAIVHEEDTTPLPISTGTSGASAVTAAPVRSLFQTACLGIRLLSLISWGLRGSGRVAVVSGIAW